MLMNPKGPTLPFIKTGIAGLSLVAFSDKAHLLLPGQSHVDPATAKSIVNAMQPGGGTEILPALQLGLEQVQRGRSKQSVNHLILLTDGRTYGDEQDCLEQAKRARTEQIHFSAMGLGSDWNEAFLDQLAALFAGASLYIDSPEKTKSVFSQIMHNLQTIVTRQLTLELNLHPPVYLREAYQIGSQISKLEVKYGKALLGTLSVGQKQAILMEFRVPKLAPGEQKLMDIIVEADIFGLPQYRSWEQVELAVEVSRLAQPHFTTPPTLKTTLKKLVVYKIQQKVTSNLEAGQIGQATHCLKIMASRLFDLGQTELAGTVLREASHLAHSRAFSAEGGKKIRYDTRQLFTLSDKVSSSNDYPFTCNL
jgi:Ca-activated chloride channel family protein